MIVIDIFLPLSLSFSLPLAYPFLTFSFSFSSSLALHFSLLSLLYQLLFPLSFALPPLLMSFSTTLHFPCAYALPLSLFTTVSIPTLSLFLSTAPNPCAANNGMGPCSHLCLINYNQTFSCACPHLMKLQADKHTCKGRNTQQHTHILRGLSDDQWV